MASEATGEAMGEAGEATGGTGGTGERVDRLLFDAAGLSDLASEAIVRRGISYFQEDRVTELGWKGEHLWASVMGSQAGEPYEVDLRVDADGELEVQCSCAFELEPACKHAVAALLAYAARQQAPEDEARGAADEAVLDRRTRGRAEVAVTHVAGEPRFGTWEARSLKPTGLSSRTYRVELRSTTERLNHCNCPDFATNRLGTCKHIEAVVHALAPTKKGRKKAVAAAGTVEAPAVSVVYLDWQGAGAPRIQVRRGREVRAELERTLGRWFDARGVLRQPWPDAMARLRAEVDGREDIHVSQDAAEHAMRLAEDAAHAAEAAEIRRDIRRGGGHVDGVRARLFPYQVEGVAFLASNGRALLADDMGLGKTLQTIAAATWMMRRRSVRRVLVVCPASLKHQWAREIERFTGADTVIVQGSLAARRAAWRQGATWTLVNYELVRRDLDEIQALSPDLLVLDEAQRIKNWRTQTADVIKAIDTRYAFVLTGTPLENRLEDLYSLLQVVDRRVLGPLWQFMLEFHVTDERGKVLGYRNLSELRRLLAPVMLRRDRRIVADQLPERIDQRIDVAMTPAQKAIEADALQTAAQYASIAKRRPLTPVEQKRLLAALQMARMACNSARLVDPEATGRTPKLEELERLLSELAVEGGEKIVIFSQWERMTQLAEEVARGLGLGVVRLHGGVATSTRGALIERFTEDPEIRVFISTDAGGTGLNLQAASALINLDLPWNPAVLAQRLARVHRLGQKRPTLIVLLVSADSYEERVGHILETKRELFTSVVAEEATGDVVGLSQRSLELAVGAIGGEALRAANEDGSRDDGSAEATNDEAAPDEKTDGGDAAAAGGGGPAEAAATLDDGRVAALVAEAQRRFGAGLERIVARPAGLLVVATAAPDEVRAFTSLGGGGVDIAVVDPATFLALQRLGLSGAEGGATVHERAAAPEDPKTALARMLQRKLQAARSLMDAGLPVEAVGMLAQAGSAACALRAGLAEPPDAARLAVWLFADAVPRGLVSAEDAALVLRAHALAGAPDLPPDLATTLASDIDALVARATTADPPA